MPRVKRRAADRGDSAWVLARRLHHHGLITPTTAKRRRTTGATDDRVDMYPMTRLTCTNDETHGDGAGGGSRTLRSSPGHGAKRALSCCFASHDIT
jgi:hypothetical protein